MFRWSRALCLGLSAVSRSRDGSFDDATEDPHPQGAGGAEEGKHSGQRPAEVAPPLRADGLHLATHLTHLSAKVAGELGHLTLEFSPELGHLTLEFSPDPHDLGMEIRPDLGDLFSDVLDRDMKAGHVLLDGGEAFIELADQQFEKPRLFVHPSPQLEAPTFARERHQEYSGQVGLLSTGRAGVRDGSRVDPSESGHGTRWYRFTTECS